VPHFQDLGVAPKPVEVDFQRSNLGRRFERVAQEIAERR
jgi:hypothetical protein